MKALSYNTTMKTARSFANHLKSSKEKFSPRPYNRHKPKDTTWWVVPGTDWPAYSYGKYIFRDQGDKIQAGVNIEKGLDLLILKL